VTGKRPISNNNINNIKIMKSIIVREGAFFSPIFNDFFLTKNENCKQNLCFVHSFIGSEVGFEPCSFETVSFRQAFAQGMPLFSRIEVSGIRLIDRFISFN